MLPRVLIALTCWIFLNAQPRSSGAPPKSIFGLYATAAQHDFIRITPANDNKINLTLKLHYANGHTCQLEKEGDWKSDHVLIVTDGLNENEPCKLEASFANGHVTLKDEGQRCAQLYCGTRGKLDAVTLPRKNTHK